MSRHDWLDKFSGLASGYDRYRPTYPTDIVRDIIQEDLEALTEHCVADVGAGTGILTEALHAITDMRICAVEPNADMRSILTAKFAGVPNVAVYQSTAENLPFENGSVGLVTVGQAFHWFDVEMFRKECQRILAPAGKVLLIWNSRDAHNPLAQDSMALFRECCPNFSGFAGGVESGYKHKDSFFTEYSEYVEESPTKFDLPGFIGRNLSMSYAPKKSDKSFVRFVSGLAALFAKYSDEDGTITIQNNIVAFYGTV